MLRRALPILLAKQPVQLEAINDLDRATAHPDMSRRRVPYRGSYLCGIRHRNGPCGTVLTVPRGVGPPWVSAVSVAAPLAEGPDPPMSAWP